MPLLACVADRDREALADFAARVVERAPRGQLRRYPASHFEMYHGEPFKRVLANQVDFLRTHSWRGSSGTNAPQMTNRMRFSAESTQAVRPAH